MVHGWSTTVLDVEETALSALIDLQGRRWLSRGQSKCRDGLIASIDRDALSALPRPAKLRCERESIDSFRSTARYFASAGEQASVSDDVVALMVLRHYGVPTRLLDWSASPHVAAYFAVSGHDESDGELWSFDEPEYEAKGKAQWRKWPETTTDGSGDDDKFAAGVTAFMVDEPPDWIITAFYGAGFPRQNAQRGAYTMTARFGVDHAVSLKDLLGDESRHARYVIKAHLKPRLRAALREQYGIWRGALFPDTAGAAETAAAAFPPATRGARGV
jgi:hypothetical protein